MGWHFGRLLRRLEQGAAFAIGGTPGLAAFNSFSGSLPRFGPRPYASSVGGTIAGGIISTIGTEIINRYAPGGSGGGRGGCGCGTRGGRDPCTGQKMTSQPAPRASFFGGCCPPGRVLRRKPYARDVCIRKPRMNVANPHALRRAIRRARGFEKLARRVLGFTSPHKPKGRAYFKKARSR